MKLLKTMLVLTLSAVMMLSTAFAESGKLYTKDADNIEFEVNLRLNEILEDTSYLETAYNQVQELADNLEPDVAAKFLSYPIPKAIVEEWEKVK